VKQSTRIDLARKLRKEQTDAEEKLWVNLRGRRFAGAKFRRQQAMGDYIVDFVSFEASLIIEVDGGQHTELPEVEKDRQRTRYLESKSYQVVRFWDNEVLQDLDSVLARIKELLEARKIIDPSPESSPARGEAISQKTGARFVR
jgi:very-short-patch-repair endonuclease